MEFLSSKATKDKISATVLKWLLCLISFPFFLTSLPKKPLCVRGNSLTRAAWSREAGQDPWEGEAGVPLGSVPPGSLQAWGKAEQLMGENSMGRRCKQQGAVYCPLTTRASCLHPCALHLQAFSNGQLSHALCQVKHFQCAVLNAIVADPAHGFPSQCHGLNVALNFVVSRSHLLKSGIKTCLLSESVQFQWVLRHAWLKRLCITDEVGAFFILSLLHVHLLCTSGMVASGINSATTGKL